MTVIIMHNTVTTHDAIGNDIEAEFKIISENNECLVFAPNQFNPNVSYISRESLDELLDDPQLVLLYHHSVYWNEGYEILKKTKGKIVFKYHNITPEAFFEPYNDFAYNQCKLGREQTDLFIKEFPNAYWIADSYYNAEDLKDFNQDRIGISAPFNKIEEWSQVKPDENILKELLETDKLNLLFVGRVAPNKGHLMLLDVLRCYRDHYDSNVKLRIIGKFDEGIPGYNELVMSRIHEYGLDHLVEFIGEINDSTLMSYYLGSDVMLCCSEHEGFCVPIVEAQFFKLPVVALRECAVPETIGPNQIVLGNDPHEFAAALKTIKDDIEHKKYLSETGRKNYESRFSYKQIRESFEKEFAKGLELV